MPSEARINAGIMQFFADYAWFLIKNLLGWILILASPWVGMLIPGPGGIPLFLIGFALISFPGKRQLTARILRGRSFDLTRRGFLWIRLVGTVLLPIIAALLIWWRWHESLRSHTYTQREIWMLCLLGLALGWLVSDLGLRTGNWLIRYIPRIRRKVRPWLRRRGIHLLPPRRIRRLRGSIVSASHSDDEILELDERNMQRLRSFWRRIKRFASRIIGILITVAVLVWFSRRITDQWSAISDKIQSTSLLRIVIASVMFAIFLLVFRALVWRRLLQEFAHRIPLWPATRIWSTSELARYVPGAIWQVLGRVYLVRPYGINALACSTSQMLELAIFVLANILAGLACLSWFAGRMDADARPYLYAAAGLAPLFLLLLHPRIFLGVTNWVLRRLKKPAFSFKLKKRLLVKQMLWNMLGLAWQGLALWVLMSQSDTLGLSLSQLPLIIGAYALAWVAGFLAVTNPAGLGVREAALVTILRFALPDEVLAHFGGDERQLKAFLMFLSLLLRLWTIIGEMMLTSLAYMLDYRGAIGRPDAPGRVVEYPSHQSA